MFFSLKCATVSPADLNYAETISTLRYAGRAKNIQNRTHINDEPKDALLRHFQEEIAELKKQLEDGLIEIGSEEDDVDDDEEEEEEEDDNENDIENETVVKKQKRKSTKNKLNDDVILQHVFTFSHLF